MPVRELSDNPPDGSRLGQTAAEKVAFWGETPVAQPNATDQGAVATTAITTVETLTTTVWAASINSLISRVDALVTLGNQVRSDLVTIGVIKGSN